MLLTLLSSQVDPDEYFAVKSKVANWLPLNITCPLQYKRRVDPLTWSRVISKAVMSCLFILIGICWNAVHFCHLIFCRIHNVLVIQIFDKACYLAIDIQSSSICLYKLSSWSSLLDGSFTLTPSDLEFSKQR